MNHCQSRLPFVSEPAWRKLEWAYNWRVSFTWFFNKKVFLLFFYDMYFWSNANMKNEKEIPVKDGTPELIVYNLREKALIWIGVRISKPCSLWIIRFNFIFKLKKIIVYQKAEMASAANISIKATPKPCSLRRS